MYFWRHPDRVDLSGVSEPDEKEAALVRGATYVEAISTGRNALVMDFNAEGVSHYTGIYHGPGARWASHPQAGRINVSFTDGSVADEDSEELWLPEPGTMTEELQWWERAHRLHR